MVMSQQMEQLFRSMQTSVALKTQLQLLQQGQMALDCLRTELLYLDRNDAPTLQEQTAIYTQLFTPFNGQKVVIRTLDAGADKPMAFINFAQEPNPALRCARISHHRWS